MLRSLNILLLLLAFTLVHAQSAYINKVYEYNPAPGQFINTLPAYEDGDSEADMIRKVEEKIVGQVGSTNYVCLGAWGGYVTFGFDHPLVNVPGENDLLVYGNAFKSGDPQDGVQFGSSEPGVIYVSRDVNGNGLPDDPWYEIAGSMAEEANRNYQITYTNAGATENIPWQDNLGATGSIARNMFHQQPYFPLWLTKSTLSFSGTLLPSNLNEANRAFMFDYGYADNWPNDDERAKINLDWAIDADGHPANLTYVDFVRVQTGVLVDWGVSGEMSTEVCGAEDLHPEAALPESLFTLGETMHGEPQKFFRNGQLIIRKNGVEYSILGLQY